MNLQCVNPLDVTDWNKRLTFQTAETFFSTREWAQVLSDAYGYKPRYLAGMGGDNGGVLMPMMEVDSWLTGRRGVSLPFSDTCEPTGVNPDGAETVLNALKDMGRQRQWRHFEVRNASAFRKDIPSSALYFSHVLNLLPGDGVLWNNLESEVRTAIRKADKSGLEVTFSTSLGAVEHFYRLHCETRRQHGLPPQPFGFFSAFHRHILSKGLGLVVTASHEGHCIAAAVFCHAGRHSLFKYAASTKRSLHLRGNTLVMWEAIRRYARQGYATLSFGRTAVTNGGLRRFKLGWGATEGILRYIQYDFKRGQFVAGDTYTAEQRYRLFRYMPLPLSQLAGTLLYRHMG